MTSPEPRKFQSPINRTRMPNGSFILDAVADDGSAWTMLCDYRNKPITDWQEITRLPVPHSSLSKRLPEPDPRIRQGFDADLMAHQPLSWLWKA